MIQANVCSAEMEASIQAALQVEQNALASAICVMQKVTRIIKLANQ